MTEMTKLPCPHQESLRRRRHRRMVGLAIFTRRDCPVQRGEIPSSGQFNRINRTLYAEQARSEKTGPTSNCAAMLWMG
jgi:hypothetical protein